MTDSKGLYDKMQHTVIAPKGEERRVDIECLALKEGMETSSNTQWGTTGQQSYQRHPDGTVSLLLEEWTTLESEIMSSKKRGDAGISTLEKPSEEDLNVEGPLS